MPKMRGRNYKSNKEKKGVIMFETIIATIFTLAWVVLSAKVSSHYMTGTNHTEKLTNSILIGFPTAIALIMFIMTIKE
jgi:EamA domain-containing membrane protein RarD